MINMNPEMQKQKNDPSRTEHIRYDVEQIRMILTGAILRDNPGIDNERLRFLSEKAATQWLETWGALHHEIMNASMSAIDREGALNMAGLRAFETAAAIWR